MARDRNKPTQSWIEEAKFEIEHEEELTLKRSYELGKIRGKKEQKAIDHSEEHLNWIIKQHQLWVYEMWHCDNNDTCTFKEWIDKATED